MLSHEQVWAAIDALAERYGLSPSGLARRAKLDPTAFNKSKRVGVDGRQRWPSTESVSKVLDATGASIDEFLELTKPGRQGSPLETAPPPQPSTIPLLGFAQAGVGGFFDGGGFPVGQGWDIVEFPSSPDRKPGVYALEVQGDGTLPLYRDGDVLIVEPGAQVRRGDRVVLKTRNGEIMARALYRQSPRTIELVSLNAMHPNRSVDVDDVEWMARIIWASQ